MADQMQHEEPYKLSHLQHDAPIGEHGKCSVCRWWAHLETPPRSDRPRACGRDGEATGECRCSEPRLAIVPEQGQQVYEGLWPITYEKDWCGKFEAQKGKGGLASGRARF